MFGVPHRRADQAHQRQVTVRPNDLLLLAAPPLLAATHVVGTYGFSDAHWTSMVRALVVSILAASLILCVALIGVRRLRPAVVAASAAVIVLAGGFLAAWTALSVGAWIVVAYWQHIHQRPWPVIDASLAARVPALLLTVSVVWLPISGTVTLQDLLPPPQASPAADQGRPNIYVLLLDGYPRADTLAEFYAFDNRSFLDSLEELGFQVAEDSESEFHQTEQSLLSMFSDEIPPEAVDKKRARHLLESAPAFDRLRDAGYLLSDVPSVADHINLRTWDETLGGPQLTELEILLLQVSALAPLSQEWVASQLRDRQDEALETLVSQTSQTRQHMTFVHLMAPHPPFLYTAVGDPLLPADCWLQGRCRIFDVSIDKLEMERPAYVDAFVGQLQHVNRRVLEALELVIERDPEASVVVLSDHGARHSNADTAELTRTLFAARIPSNPGLFEANPGPDLLMSRLLGASRGSGQP